MNNYYCLVAGLPDISLEDSKLSYSPTDFRNEFYDDLAKEDQKVIDLFFLKYDNANLLKLLNDADTNLEKEGLYSAEQINEFISLVKEGTSKIKGVPEYITQFISQFIAQKDDESVLWEDRLASLYFNYAIKVKNPFVASWFEFNLNLNNIFVALTARKYKMELSSVVVGDTDVCEAIRTSSARDFGLTGELEYFEQLSKIFDLNDLVEREKKTDLVKWEWMEDNSFFNYFSVEKIFVFLEKLEMIQRWIALDKELGNKLFRSIIDSLKDDVKIPQEFRL